MDIQFDKISNWLNQHFEAILIFFGGTILGLVSTKAKRAAETQGIVAKTMSGLLEDINKHKDEIGNDCKKDKKELRDRIQELKVSIGILRKDIDECKKLNGLN